MKKDFHYYFDEAIGVASAFRNFKLFLARMVGFVAIVYGVFTFQLYFIVLGTAAVIMFWVWDRLDTTQVSSEEANSAASDDRHNAGEGEDEKLA